MRPPKALLLSLVLAFAVLIAGCGPTSSTASQALASSAAASEAPATNSAGGSACPTSNTTPFDKTKFVLHAGLAFGAFHRYLYKPYRAGTFTTGTKTHRVLTFTKAGAAALFVKREVRLASEDVKGNPTLCKAIAAPLASLGDNISGAVTKLKGGDASGLSSDNGLVSQVEKSATGGGAPITENQGATVG